MKTKKVIALTRPLVILLTIAVACSFLMLTTATVQAAAKKPVKLTWVSIVPLIPGTGPFFMNKFFFEEVNKKSNGEIIWEFLGGPEVIAHADLGNAVKNGIIGAATPSFGAYEAIVPGVMGMILSNLTLDEEQVPGGLHDYAVEQHKKGGLMFLGRGTPSETDFFYTFLRNKKAETKEDFAKLNLAVVTSGRPAVQAWGATPISVASEETYTSLERGMVNGIAAAALANGVTQGLREVIDYVIDVPYYKGSLSCIMNLDSFNGLTAGQQKLLIDTYREAERKIIVASAETDAKRRSLIEQAGVEFYKLSPEMAEWYVTGAYRAGWEYQAKRFPEQTAAMRAFMK